MIFIISVIATIATVILFFAIERINGIRKIVAKILVNSALIIGLISLYLCWYFLFKWIL